MIQDILQARIIVSSTGPFFFYHSVGEEEG